jgi:glutamyl-tRNA synthetase
MGAGMRSRGRFAPSPTGRLHLGNLRSALLGWLSARSRQGEFLLRIEDLDPERCRPELVGDLYRDLEFLGLDWDEPVLVQSQRHAVYAAALDRLRAQGDVYACSCSRAEIARAASAPHLGEEGPVYPGTCRGGAAPKPGRPAALRFRARPGLTRFVDALRGECAQDVSAEVGDFVVCRGDGVPSYQLAVVVDDAASGVTEVLRGDDLLSSTPRQLQLYQALALSPPSYVHVPLLLQVDGKRLAKREGATTVAGLRERNVPAEAIVGLLAKWSGLGDGTPVTPRELLRGFSVSKLTRAPTTVHDTELATLWEAR